MPPDLLQDRMSPTGRALVGTAGLALALAGAHRGGLRGLFVAALGGALAARAITNESPRAIVTSAPGVPVSVRRTMDVSVPVRRAFACWSNFREFPRFMEHVREVTESESGISHWTVDGPGGEPISWDVEILALQPHRRIAWRTIPGSNGFYAGEVRFEELDESRTRIMAQMVYAPQDHGPDVDRSFGSDPRGQLETDMAGFQALVELSSTKA